VIDAPPRESSTTRTAHAESIASLATALETDPTGGLAPAEALRRYEADGPNRLRRTEGPSAVTIFAAQFGNLVIWVLIGAAIVSFALGEVAESGAILAIVLLNALIGFFQEFRAERAAAALARLTAPRARVIRDGRMVVVPAPEVVRGDLLALEAGDLVAADARLVEAAVLRANEAPLTGESLPVEKHIGECPPATALADRFNMVFLGTSIANGSGRALVVATGMSTEVGHIAALLESAGTDDTPLRHRLDFVARRLLWACLGIVLVVFALGLVRSVAPFELFLGAVSLAVAAIPEGLPAVVTVALALGVQRMVHRNALVRRLAAVETLGCAQVICTDKTGTLTVGEMTVRKLATADHAYNVTGEGYSTGGVFVSAGIERSPAKDSGLRALLTAAAACTDAELGSVDGRPVITGDPTEGALLVAAAKAGIIRADIEQAMPRRALLPFDSERKRMAVVRERDAALVGFVKGAPESLLERCTRIATGAGDRELTPEARGAWMRTAASMANDALRVLAVAERPLADGHASDWADPDVVERDLTFLGLVAMQDPPRAEARDAVNRCRRAGIKTVMITGDHPDTARAIGRELGIVEGNAEPLTGAQLERMDDGELTARVAEVAVYARVTAEHKLRIVRAWKARGNVVAMTGDGVNDAPALKEASIGVAMGITGTEVTKEAADIIITDDNFASIVAAVEEGRGIYDNIAKTLSYLLAGNAGELAVMLIAALAGWPLPLLPLHLLWINLVTDGLPALALATDPIDADVLARPPRPAQAQLLDREFLRLTALTGCLTAATALGAFAYEYYVHGTVEQARDAAFTVLVVAEVLRSFGARSASRTIWELGLFTNLRLFVVVAAAFWFQVAIHHAPALQLLFGIEPLSLGQCLGWMALGALPLAVLELRKVFLRRAASAA
jgi:Ca2+-transporting ATPase